MKQTTDAAVYTCLFGQAGIVLLHAGERLAVHLEAAGGHAVTGVDDAVCVRQYLAAAAGDGDGRSQTGMTALRVTDDRLAVALQHILHGGVLLLQRDLGGLLADEEQVSQQSGQQSGDILANQSDFHGISSRSINANREGARTSSLLR